jgi:hypothetical protein
MSAQPIFDLTFEHNYDVQLAEELPGNGQGVIYLPGGSTTSGKDGFLLRFSPIGGSEWLGCFAFGFHPSSQYTLSGVFATPNPSYAVVISGGVAYRVNAATPRDCSQIRLSPVRDIRVVVPQNLLALADFTSVEAIGRDGSHWKSERLCWDDLSILEIRDGILHGAGSDPTNALNPESEFLLDLKTGRALRSAYSGPQQS